MAYLISKAPCVYRGDRGDRGNVANKARRSPALLLAGLLLVLATACPAFAQRCTTQNGQTICCDNSGNCYSK